MNTNMQAHGSDTDNGDEDDIPEPIISLLDSNTIDISCEELTKFDMKNMKNTRIHMIKSHYKLCQITQQQATSSVWMRHRAGKIIASLYQQVSRMEGSRSLIERIMQYKQDFY